jgi:hypothetical protein
MWHLGHPGAQLDSAQHLDPDSAGLQVHFLFPKPSRANTVDL